jgi:uncharacterized protein (TIGR00251 family)
VDLAHCLKNQADAVLLNVRAQPRASKNAIGPVLGDELKIRVTAPPVDGVANEALVRFLAETLGVAKGDVRLVKGKSTRRKTFLITGTSQAEVLQRLTSVMKPA